MNGWRDGQTSRQPVGWIDMLYTVNLPLFIVQLYVRSAQWGFGYSWLSVWRLLSLGFTTVSGELTALNMEHVLSKG